jgi:hypothetical protein
MLLLGVAVTVCPPAPATTIRVAVAVTEVPPLIVTVWVADGQAVAVWLPLAFDVTAAIAAHARARVAAVFAAADKLAEEAGARTTAVAG